MNKKIKKIIFTFALVLVIFGIFKNSYAAAPLPPTNIRAEAGDSKATISFTPDLTNLGAGTTYVVTSVAKSLEPIFSGTGASSPIVVAGLTNGQSYKFVVKAKNASGVSVNSVESNIVVPNDIGTIHDPGVDIPQQQEGGAKNILIRYVNPIAVDDLEGFMAKIIDSAVLLLTPIIVIMLIWTGFLFISARGNPESLASAKKALLYVLIGATIILIAKGFSLAIRGVFSQF